MLQVAFEIGRQMIRKDAPARERPIAVFAGVLVGMLTLYVTGVAIK